MNQCDGCRVSAPLTERGNHAMPDGGFMGCTKERYLGDACSHGKPWSEECPECNLVAARELVAHWGSAVDEARKMIAANKRHLFTELVEGIDELKRMREEKEQTA